MKSIQYKSVELEEVPGVLELLQDKIYDKLGEMYMPKTIYISKKKEGTKFICVCETLMPVEVRNSRIEEQEKMLASATKADIISFTPIFGVLSKSKIKKISPLLKTKKFKEDEVIFKEGVRSDELYIIRSGKVIIYKYIDEGEQNFEVLATLCKGDILGEMAVLDDQPRSAWAKTVAGPCELYCMNKKDFLDILQKYPEISLNLNKIYCQRLRATSKQLINYISLTGLSKVPDREVMAKTSSGYDKGEKGTTRFKTKKMAGEDIVNNSRENAPPSADEIMERRREMLARNKGEGRSLFFRKPKHH